MGYEYDCDGSHAGPGDSGPRYHSASALRPRIDWDRVYRENQRVRDEEFARELTRSGPSTFSPGGNEVGRDADDKPIFAGSRVVWMAPPGYAGSGREVAGIVFGRCQYDPLRILVRWCDDAYCEWDPAHCHRDDRARVQAKLCVVRDRT